QTSGSVRPRCAPPRACVQCTAARVRASLSTFTEGLPRINTLCPLGCLARTFRGATTALARAVRARERSAGRPADASIRFESQSPHFDPRRDVMSRVHARYGTSRLPMRLIAAGLLIALPAAASAQDSTGDLKAQIQQLTQQLL